MPGEWREERRDGRSGDADRAALDGHHVPAAARHRHPSGARQCCGWSRPGSSATTTSRSSATRRASGTSARSSGCGSGCGSSPAARSTSRTSATTSSTRSPTCRSSSCASPTDEIKAYSNACLHRGRQLKDYDGRLHRRSAARSTASLGARRRWLKTCPRALGLPPRRRRRRVRAARGQGRHVGRVRVHQPRSRRRAARGLPRRAAPTQFERWELENRYVQAHVHEGDPGQLEDRAGGVLRGVPRRRHAPADPRRTSATPTARSTSGTTSRG